MRITYRNKNNKQYWEDRWQEISADSGMKNTHVYPLKYSELLIKDKRKKILEAGCGAGRLLRYYHNSGYDITGFDFIDIAVEKLKTADSTLKVEVGDITTLNYQDETFDYVLAFGLYHNLEHDLDKAISETYRVLRKGGHLCASFRADNIQTRLTDWLATTRLKQEGKNTDNRVFHKLNLTQKEFEQLFIKAGFSVDKVCPVENMPILYKFSFFRSSKHKTFDENLARKEGYQLSSFGKLLQSTLMRLFPYQFCNIFVIYANKP